MKHETTTVPKPKKAANIPSEKKASKLRAMGTWLGNLLVRLLCSLLLKPYVWRWLMVHLLEAADSIEEKAKALLSILDSFFGG
ncbi:hypothetical protein J2S30_000862 [Herbaspirillum rubrisubalbicans]|uniref:hypothetical protein n=1 Tax=Herbaspirillum rubrisubalbicans TaxID=80842 RepID=UPI00209DA50E|nr:hypothetical protein [Herbaspirillum rubrisubalbicans]MCP1572483.1 hypothetical protein [Herbaspirillum rubrisubalbicans]